MAGGKGKSSSGGRDHPVRAEPQHGSSKTSNQEKAQVTGNESQSGIASTIETVSLVLIAAVAFAIRLFSIVKYESVIHEFDPYFNYRVTQLASEKGVDAFWNFFDDRTWYPLGRVVGGTIYPGLTLTATWIHWFLKAALKLHPVEVKDVCVMIGPLFSSFTAISTYLMVRQIKGRGAGLLAASFVATIPSYISRSVAGSYDNESVAIFALTNTFYLYLKSIDTGSMFWGVAASLSYFYMVSSWGGYTFIINLIPIHALALLIIDKFNWKLYTGYSMFIVNGTVLAMVLPVIGFNAVETSEHFSGFFVLALMNGVALVKYLKRTLTREAYKKAFRLFVTTSVAVMGVVSLAVITFAMTSPTLRWSGRSLSLLDPTYASKYIPIIASVSEHQAPSWSSFVNDLRLAIILMASGIVSCFRPLTAGSLFLVIWGVLSVYFSAVMVRLMLVLAPAACCLAGIAMSDLLEVLCRSYHLAQPKPEDAGRKEDGQARRRGRRRNSGSSQQRGTIPRPLALLGISGAIFALSYHLFHCSFLGGEGYSSPSIILQSRTRDGGVYIFDDYREGYSWLRENTDYDAKVASWWDYGYQTTAMADRTVLVDNNTWNNTHIATVGRAMASPEESAWKQFRALDVDYVFVIFGGLVGYSSDDINKFLWMVRIGGGVYGDIKERDYIGEGYYRIDEKASPVMLNTLMYKLSYYRFAETVGRDGQDRVRNTKFGNPDVKLTYFREAFTSKHWMIRIYEVLEEPLLEQAH
ncbi:subunit STT3 of oligosaccharyl transferase [Chloropicon roscoffensis]|uniref:dolichyl-diphosphooligosaccharide--protein glycotransferase n=1 Tax=Chloropicon roscoffensis TaxID=1461544 RepID=A0AAX4P0P7_9CHLO